jgi:hypothetical protein
MMMPDGPVYEERARWTQQHKYFTGFSVLALITFFLELELPLLVRVITIAISAAAACWGIIIPATRMVVLRVDDAGITLGGSLPRPGAARRVIPWDEVRAVFVWQRPYIGARLFVERAAGAPPLSPGGTGPADRQAVVVPPDAPYPWRNLTIGAARGLQSVTLDESRLAAAIARYAPSVPVGRLTSIEEGPVPIRTSVTRP